MNNNNTFYSKYSIVHKHTLLSTPCYWSSYQNTDILYNLRPQKYKVITIK